MPVRAADRGILRHRPLRNPRCQGPERSQSKEQPMVKQTIFAALALILLAGSPIARAAQGDLEGLKAKYSSYTIEQAASEGYARDAFCIDAASFGQPAERGAMGFHATDQSRIRGP